MYVLFVFARFDALSTQLLKGIPAFPWWECSKATKRMCPVTGTIWGYK